MADNPFEIPQTMQASGNQSGAPKGGDGGRAA